MEVALITGANKGIGFETAKILARKGYFVYLGCRSGEKGEAAVAKLHAEGLVNIAAVPLDVTDSVSVDAARRFIGSEQETLDVLINNAGISGVFEQAALATEADEFQKVYDTNVFGVVRVTQAFMDLLRRSSGPRIVNVSTSMASLALAAEIDNPAYPKRFVVYQSSKAALNMYTVNLAFELRDTAFKVNAVCPGYTRTDFTGQQGTSAPEEAGARIAKYAMIDAAGPTGRFFSEEYFPDPAVCPW